MATSDTFANGKKIKLTVGAPWWSWLWGGLIYQPGEGTVKATKKETRTVRQWWCFWLCSSEETVTVEARVDRIVIEALGASDNPAGELLTDLGNTRCTNCRSLTHTSHQFGFPLPPWLGSGFKGVGYRATVEENGEVITLSRHWSSVGGDSFARLTLPDDFQT